MTEPEIAAAQERNRQFVEELKALKFSDSAAFRTVCEEYAAQEYIAYEEAVARLKPICDARERAL